MLHVDQGRVIQALTNLVSNAIRFSPAGKTVEVEASEQGDEVLFQVMDHGPGIPARFRDKIFSPFAQANTPDSRQAGGTGLGLAITKAIVERHGGTIGFENGEAQGARFFFTLPTRKPPAVH